MRQTSKGSLERKLRDVHLRDALNVVLRQAAVVLALAGGAAALALLAEKLFCVPVVSLWSSCILAGAAVLLIAGLSALRAPGRMQVALQIDRRLAFRERFSTALALSASDDPFARAATKEAHEAAERLDVRGQFPVRPSGHWLAALATWLIAAGIFAFLPEMDVLGYVARRNEQQRQAAELEQAKTEVKDAAAKVRAAADQVDEPQIAAELDKLGELTQGVKPADVRREAIRKLGELAERLQELQKPADAQADDQMKQMLKGLRTSPEALDNDLNRALASGDFSAAAKMLQEMLQKLNDNQLTEEQKRKLAEQLKNLAEQLAGLAQPKDRTEDLLQQQGMDAETARKLVGLSEKDLRQALKDQGLTDEQIDKLMEKLQAARQACQKGQGLSKSLAQCSGEMGELLPGGLVGLIEGLEGMSQSDAERAGLEEALKEIERAVALLGEGQCQGDGMGDPNAVGLWQPGGQDMPGQGPGGGRAQAWGQRPVGPPEDTGVKKTGVKNQPPKEEHEIIASWLFKGAQAKGVSKRQLTGAVRAAKDSAAEAISDNKIPRKYEGAVKKYFGGLEEAAGDANQP